MLRIGQRPCSNSKNLRQGETVAPSRLEERVGGKLRRLLPCSRLLEALDLSLQNGDALVELGERQGREVLPDLMRRRLGPGLFLRDIDRHGLSSTSLTSGETRTSC